MNQSESGDLIQKNKTNILSSWEKELVRCVPEARELSHPIIIDTLPNLIDNIVEGLADKSRRAAALDSTIGLEHGGERARLTNFNLSALIQEFRILREVLIKLLHANNADQSAINLVHVFIDEAIQSSATAFALVQAELREHVIATLTHDMRSPLTAANLAADLILKKSRDESVIFQAKKIKVNHRRMDNLIQDLLNTTLLKAGGKLNIQIEEVDFKHLVDEIAESLPEPHLNRLDRQVDEIRGYWDKSHLRRAIENLISNAFKYGHPDSPVTISAKEADERLIFSVHNLGPHIPKEEQEAIFQIFSRADSAREGKRPGWGLGLPIVRSVAEAHGGSLSLNSLQENGTTFIIDIPKDARPFVNSPAH